GLMENVIHVLLVEDNDEQVKLLEQMLQRSVVSTFHLERVALLSEATARISQRGMQLILLDLTLPDSDGIETFKRVQEVALETPIIVLSGIEDEALAIETVQ